MQRSDIAGALAIQAASYPATLQEDAAAFSSRIDLPNSYCVIARSGEELLAYLLAHGWTGNSPPPLGAQIAQPAEIDTLYLHDLAVAPAGRGSDLGRKLVEHALALAAQDGLHRAELIAVFDAWRYWETLDFSLTAATPAIAAKLAGYGPDARWMTREFQADTNAGP
ncbi:GNAT family N-acetyltransferase [Erythrobacter alti]|uniref:GNAT family N-acetyltransferase n=1 Tax=Erythrobacter alti TaxID=1896145 RepID=UPI0030F4417B